MRKSTPSFPDHNQNFWQLASIQGASQGIVAIFMGGMLAKQYGSLVTLSSICVGNLFLWIIGLGVIFMSAKNRLNIIQTVQEYLGKVGGFLMILILMSAFIFWYTIELQVTVEILAPLFPVNWQLELIGLCLGVIVSFFSIGGIRLIKILCVFLFPLMLSFIFYFFVFYGQFTLNGNWGISFAAAVTVASIMIPGVVNFGTFFRHSRSKSDSILALTLTILSFILFEIVGVFVFSSGSFEVFGEYVLYSGPVLYIFPTIVFVLMLFVCINLTNIYLASAGLEVLLPKFSVHKGYFLIGLLGSLFYFFAKSSLWVSLAEQTVDNFIVNLGVVLLVSFFVKNLVKHRPRKWEQWINCACWLIGCVTTIIVQRNFSDDSNRVLLSGIWSVLLSFVIIIFIEEFIHSSKLIKSVAGPGE